MSVDLVRVLAMALMVQGHTLDVLLTPEIQSASWYNFWLFCRGFTAPIFMTLAGFSFALATSKKWTDHIQLGSPVYKRIRRFMFFVLLGYAMRFPVHSVRDLKWVAPEHWQTFLQVDVLQTTGLTLIALQLLVLALRSKARFVVASFALSLLIAFTAPFVWNSGLVQALPLAMKSAFVGTSGSLFPLLPWSAYLFFGAAAGFAYTMYRRSNTSLLRYAIPVGVALVVAGESLEKVFHGAYGDPNFWPTTPHLFITRIGFVMAVLGLATFIERFVRSRATTIRSLAEESLLVYFVHVTLLYGSMWNPGLKQLVGGTMGFAQAYPVVILLVCTMMMMAYFWNRAKRGYPTPSYAFRTALFAVAAIAVA